MLHFGNGLPMQQLHDCRKRCANSAESSFSYRAAGLSEKYF